ncbi:MAG: thiamine-monophosphate kinase [Verrucomicrobiales bacterium]
MSAGRSSKLRSVGEDALIALLTQGLTEGGETLVGVGDDCAVLGKRGQRSPYTLFKTDCIVEGVHYLPDADPAKVGWKAMARAVSDIAAMGGWPVAALATVVLHPDTPLTFARGLYRGFQKVAVAFDFGVVGGETSQAPMPGSNVISVSMLGKVEPGRCVLRSTASAGDEVFVTGKLGGSIKGRHLTFQPRLEQARWLVQHCKPTAMMDVSDGVAKDLPRLAAASGVGYTLDQPAIPRNRGCTAEQGLNDGEDYELLLTFSKNQTDKLTSQWMQQFPKLPLTRIGNLRDLASTEKQQTGGWDHFR